MNFQAEPVTINTLLSVSKQYYIPRYQRDFSWEKENIDELWSDLLECISIVDGEIKCEEYFIGTLVLAGRDEDFRIEVVDGQQRLSIITMLISAISRALVALGEDSAGDSTFTTFIKGKDRKGVEFAKIERNGRSDFFKLLIQDLQRHECSPKNEEDELIKSAFDYISERLLSRGNLFKSIYDKSKGTDSELVSALNALIDLIADHLKVIRVNVIDTDDAYMIFEILNARGINLSPVDLIKNKLLASWGTAYPIDFALSKWTDISNNLSSRANSVSIDDYAVHHWTTIYPYTSNRNLYKSFKKRLSDVKQPLEPQEYLIDLHEKSSLYMKIASPMQLDWKQIDQKPIYESLTALRTFNVSIMRSFVLSLLTARENKKITQKKLILTLRFIENFHFIFNAICSLRPSGIEGIYATHARTLNNVSSHAEARKNIDELVQKLKRRLPTSESFKDKLVKLSFTNDNVSQKKLIQYLFIRLERDTSSAEFEPKDLTIEHIMPQASGNTMAGLLGNLIPLGSKLNELADTCSFDQKLNIYANSDFETVKRLISLKTYDKGWNEQEINEWGAELARWSVEVFWPK